MIGILHCFALSLACSSKPRDPRHLHFSYQLSPVGWQRSSRSRMLASFDAIFGGWRAQFSQSIRGELHRLEENIGAVNVELSLDNLRELDTVASKIPVQGARYPEELQKLVGR